MTIKFMFFMGRNNTMQWERLPSTVYQNEGLAEREEMDHKARLTT